MDPNIDVEITEDSLKDVTRQLEKEYQNGVPIGVIAAVMKDLGKPMAETLDEIYEIRMGGGLYEPQDDHLSAF
ncbi:hypothetical protein [Haloarcula amylovorans]|uniref:hypothetical protein n=1 Tax=Haloarcula amylovorans TaxID=2562280 RepID=UPI001ADDD59B|nr:hypothetical protein [Halomicroarcula amylolytica]